MKKNVKTPEVISQEVCEEGKNSNKSKKIHFWYRFTVRDIVICSFILAMFIAAKSLNSLIPDFLPYIRFQLIYLLLPIISLVFGWKLSGITMSIYIFIIAWLAPGFFIRGITDSVVKDNGGAYVFLEYLLDYVIPILSLAIIPGLFASFKNKIFVFMFITIAFTLVFASHFLAGVLIWSSYAQWGYSAMSYSAAANGIIVWSAYGFAMIFSYPCATRVRISMKKIFNDEGYNSKGKNAK
ncbi:energy-coupled thiamine transporter ThiT [Mycoplasma marinum]|uniref:Thiamine transporter n=1 Tax=Mycoplasma marinum TaxID=1937190 RepID=A0A4R0XJW1_9MOLU|nr:energy-coupled thiamine transporter ThiT [Mycoplasma marinum]TCG10936.1 hypothetical protein C4B24_03435 [Mycoplasma marinum]